MDFLKQSLKDLYPWRDLARCRYTEAQLTEVSKGLPKFEFRIPKLRVGIEVEVENIRDEVDMDPNVWGVKEDGSLRNRGREYICLPIKGDEITYAVHNLFKALPARADFSERTSIHVHVNVRPWEVENVLNLQLLYIVFERLLYRFAGPARYKNIFCVPVQETRLPIAMSDFLQHKSFPALLNDWAKYSGLNLLPIKQFGSVEYRQMQGHRNPMLLLRWINLLQHLHATAANWKFEDLFSEIRKLNTTSAYEGFLKDVFKQDSKLLLEYDLKKEMETGVTAVKLITLPSPFFTHLMAGISNESPLLKGLGLDEAKTKKAQLGEFVKVNEHILMQMQRVNAEQFIIDDMQQWEDGNR